MTRVGEQSAIEAATRAVDAALAEVSRQGGPGYLLVEARNAGLHAARSFLRATLGQAPMECTAVAASWCPTCGDCSCPRIEGERQEENPRCPLHGAGSNHAEDFQVDEISVCLRALQYALSLPEPPTLAACIEWIDDYESRREEEDSE